MNCPICHIPLTMAERHGIEIDYCSKCRGVWLDRGELDKIIERATAAMSPQTSPERSQDHDDYRHFDKHHDKHHHDHHSGHYKKRRGFLHELFD